MKKAWMMAMALVASSQAMAFGEAGRWSSGWGQGVSEYTVVANQQTSLYIACSPDNPPSMTLTVAGVQYGTHTNKPFNLIIDGKEIDVPYDTRSEVGSANFNYAWNAIRKAKTLKAKISSGKVISLPVKDAAKALPSSKSKEFDCRTEF